MAAAAIPLVFASDFDPRTGAPVRVAPGIQRVTAPNRGPYTFTGTNSFLLGEEKLAVVDPGPGDARHLSALVTAIGGRKVEAILLTHTHSDHCGLARQLQAATGAPLWFEGRHRLSRKPYFLEVNPVAAASDWTLRPDRALQDGETIDVAGMKVAVIATPGHCANHLCFGVRGSPWLFSGDHVMGWSSTLVPVPDGSMADYLQSLHKLIALPYAHYLPAHGGQIDDGPAYAAALLAHREARNDQIDAAIAAGTTSIGALRRAIYPDLALALVPAARMTLRAHVEYLEALRKIVVRRTPFGLSLSPAA